VSQQEEINRVKANIGDLVEAFVLHRWQVGQPRFVMRDLHDYIFVRTQIAPASPDRILRQLRQEGKFDYDVIDRRASCYQITAVGTSRTAGKKKTVTLLHRGRPVDHFEAKGRRFRLPAHVIDHLFASSDFELVIG
jgi:hypothetical protein